MEAKIWQRHYEPGVPPSIDYLQLGVPGFLRRSAAERPSGTALVFRGARISYGRLIEEVGRFGAGLVQLGVRRGTRVAIHAPNLPQTVIAYQAALAIGAEVVMTNPVYTGAEIAQQWNDAGCELAVTMDFLYDQRLRAIRSELPVEHFVVARVPEYLPIPARWIAPLVLSRAEQPLWARLHDDPGVVPYAQVVRADPPAQAPPEPDLDDVAVVQYTGGTTGRPKGALLTHRNLSVNVQQMDAWFTQAEFGSEVSLGVLPLFHVFGMTVAMNWTLAKASTLVLVPNPRDIGAIVSAIEKERVTVFAAVPAIFSGINRHPGVEKLDLSSVKVCVSGSAPLPQEVLDTFERLTGGRIVEGFGLSETSPVTHVNPLSGTRKIGTIGIPVPDTEARIVDSEDGDRELGVGQEGELLLRGPQVMQGYWNRPEETAEVLQDGWFRTGDLAAIDADGYFRIVGRKKDMINVSGLKVYPDEVDQVLFKHPDVLESATIGVPSSHGSEHVKSFVVLRPGAKVGAEALRAHCAQQLADYKVPRTIEFLEELPKSSVLKVLRKELREREAKKAPARKTQG